MNRVGFAVTSFGVCLLVLLFARHYTNNLVSNGERKQHVPYPSVCLPTGYVEKNFTLIVWVPSRPYRELERRVVFEGGCGEREVFTTDLEQCLQAADVVVFHLMAPELTGAKSPLKRALDAKGRRPSEHEQQVWIGVSYEASDWVPNKMFVHNDSGVAMFDYLFVHENCNLLSHWDLTPFADAPPPAQRTHDALLLVSNCGPTPSRREELLRFLVSGHVRKHDVRLESLGECWRAPNATWPIATATRNATHRWASDWDRKKIQLLQQFRFEIIMQNAICPYYIDEKLPLALRAGAIPVWLGPPESNSRMYEPADVLKGAPESIIYFNDFESVDDLFEYLYKVKTNATLLAMYHAWREHPPSHWPRFVPANLPPVTCRMAALAGKRSAAKPVQCVGSWDKFFSI